MDVNRHECNIARSSERANRRTVLLSGVAGIGMLTAGCLGSDDSDDGAGVSGADVDAEPGETLVVDGEVIEVGHLSCNDPGDRGTLDFIAASDVVDSDAGFNLRVRQPGEDDYDDVYIVSLVASQEGDDERYRTYSDRDDDAIEFDWDDTTSGEATLSPDNDAAEDANPDGVEVVWDLAC